MEKQSQIDNQKQIDLAAESLAKILLQQVLSRKNPEVHSQIESKTYDKSNK